MICRSPRAAATRLVRTAGIPRPPPQPHRTAASHRSRSRFSSQVPRPSEPSEPSGPSMSTAERSIADLLRQKLRPTELLVRDVSGGCGSMYAIDIASPAFKGATMLKQQRMVNAALGDVIKGWHGVQLNTRVSE